MKALADFLHQLKLLDAVVPERGEQLADLVVAGVPTPTTQRQITPHLQKRQNLWGKQEQQQSYTKHCKLRFMAQLQKGQNLKKEKIYKDSFYCTLCGRVMSLDVSDCEIGVCLYAGW
jgi:hypothetical protein